MKNLLHIEASNLTALGVVDWGYTEEMQPHSFERFSEWLPANQEALPFLTKGKNLHYRSDLQAFWPKARSSLVFLFSYAPAKKTLKAEGHTRVAGYSLGFDGRDYHGILKARLTEIASLLQTQQMFSWKHSHDTEAILERDLAYRAGLGWFGKNSMLISRQHGSYFMLGSLVLDQTLPIEIRPSSADHCGSCNACVEACPTGAIDPQTRTLKVKDCLSTWTIEDRSAHTPAPLGTEGARGEIFGCDICQDVCPWNGKPLEGIAPHLGANAQKWLHWFSRDAGEIAVQVAWMTNRGFLRLMEGTPFGRPGRSSFLRTLAFWMKR